MIIFLTVFFIEKYYRSINLLTYLNNLKESYSFEMHTYFLNLTLTLVEYNLISSISKPNYFDTTTLMMISVRETFFEFSVNTSEIQYNTKYIEAQLF